MNRTTSVVVLGAMLVLPMRTQQLDAQSPAPSAQGTSGAATSRPQTRPQTESTSPADGTATQAVQGNPSRPAPAAGSNPEYKLGSGDLIEISVFGVENYRHERRIPASGDIQIPFVESVRAAGLTTAELEQTITGTLKDRVIKDPQVSVFVKEYRSQPVYVLGAVKNPGQYQMSTQLRLVDALALAGGVQNTAVDQAVIQRQSVGDEDQTINVDLHKLLEEGDLSLNVVVVGGDTIHVAERVGQTVFVVGEVNRPGAFAIPPKQEMRVSQAIVWAGGPQRTAKLSKGLLVRYGADGTREQRPVDFGQIMQGKAEDFFVKPDDIVFVPGSSIKTFGYGLLQGLPSTVMSMPYAIP